MHAYRLFFFFPNVEEPRFSFESWWQKSGHGIYPDVLCILKRSERPSRRPVFLTVRYSPDALACVGTGVEDPEQASSCAAATGAAAAAAAGAP